MRPDDVLGGDSLDAPAKLAVAEAAKTAGAAPAHTAHSTIETGKPEPVQAITDIYTCPMHPEVTSTAPGTCPKCGMTLVKKASKKDN
jgi:hypothetical protein